MLECMTVDILTSLQTILSDKVGVKVEKMNIDDMRRLIRVLMNCKSLLEEKYKDSLIRFTQFVFGLATVELKPI